MNTIGKKQETRNRTVLQKIARGIMLMRGLLPDFSAECDAGAGPNPCSGKGRQRPACSRSKESAVGFH